MRPRSGRRLPPLVDGFRRALLVHGWGYRSGDVEAFGFADGRPLAQAGRFLGGDWAARHVHALNHHRADLLTEDKWVFYRFAHGCGLPVPRTLGLFDAVHGTTWDVQRPLRTVHQVLAEVARHRPEGLVLKPVGGGQGRQVLILDRIDHGTGEAVTRAGGTTTLEEALGSLDLAGVRGFSGYVVQEPLRNHDAVQALAPWTTNTVRVLTLLGSSGAPHVQAAVVRLGRRGGTVDNVSAGGVAVPVDLRTGVLGRGHRKRSPEDLTHHPDTGVAITGAVVPHWSETLELCRRAAPLFPGLRSLGWDVVVTPQGPVVLEANARWSHQILQLHGDGLLGDPDVRAQLAEAGVPLPTGRLTRGAVVRAAESTRARLRR